MPLDLSVKNPELLGENKKMSETVEDTNTQDTSEETSQNTYSRWTKTPDENADLPREWERSDGLKVIQTKKTSFMVILADGTELRGPKGRLRTWRTMEKVIETLDVEHPVR